MGETCKAMIPVRNYLIALIVLSECTTSMDDLEQEKHCNKATSYSNNFSQSHAGAEV